MDFSNHYDFKSSESIVPVAFEASGHMDKRSADRLRTIFINASPNGYAANQQWSRFRAQVSVTLQRAHAASMDAYVSRSLPSTYPPHPPRSSSPAAAAPTSFLQVPPTATTRPPSPVPTVSGVAV